MLEKIKVLLKKVFSRKHTADPSSSFDGMINKEHNLDVENFRDHLNVRTM